MLRLFHTDGGTYGKQVHATIDVGAGSGAHVTSHGVRSRGRCGGRGGGNLSHISGAESLVESSVDQVATRAQAVMSAEGIVPDASNSESGGDKREFKGKKGDLDVTIQLERESASTTRVEVTARKNLAEWDKEYAQQLLSRIIEKG
jgi:hypothetical protein